MRDPQAPIHDRDREPDFDHVHALLAHWAARRPKAWAIDDGVMRLSFEELAARVAAGPFRGASPAPLRAVWVDAGLGPGDQLVEFLSILAAGHVAAVADPDWPAQLRREVADRLLAAPALPEGSFYIGFTSGSTGMPKGFIRSHRSWTTSFEACIDAFGPAVRTPVLAPGRLSHSLFLFNALLGLWTGVGAHLQRRFSARAALRTLARGDARSLVAVPSQLILMLEEADRHGPRAVEATQLVMISGAPWPRARAPHLQALFPRARIVEFYGTSETSFIAWTDSRADLPAEAVGRPFANVELRIVPPDAGPHAPGLIYVRSPMVFTRYVTPEPAHGPAALLRDGDWISVGDMGHLDGEGLLHLAGRRQRMFVVQGKNLFPEEVEHVLAAHPSVASVSVQAVPDPLRGLRAVAVLELAAPVDRATLAVWCRARLEPYKTPRRVLVCDRWPRTVSGKTDHAALARLLAAHPEGPPGWRILPWRLALP